VDEVVIRGGDSAVADVVEIGGGIISEWVQRLATGVGTPGEITLWSRIAGRGRRRLCLPGVEIAVPRARLSTADGTTQEWQSAVLPRYARRTRQADALIASAYLFGIDNRGGEASARGAIQGRRYQGRGEPGLAQAEERLGSLARMHAGTCSE